MHVTKRVSVLQEMQDEGKLGVGGGTVGSKVALNPKKKIPFQLKEKISLSHNTRLFRFALQSPEHKLGLPVGQHMFFYCKVNRWQGVCECVVQRHDAMVPLQRVSRHAVNPVSQAYTLLTGIYNIPCWKISCAAAIEFLQLH